MTLERRYDATLSLACQSRVSGVYIKRLAVKKGQRAFNESQHSLSSATSSRVTLEPVSR